MLQRRAFTTTVQRANGSHHGNGVVGMVSEGKTVHHKPCIPPPPPPLLQCLSPVLFFLWQTVMIDC